MYDELTSPEVAKLSAKCGFNYKTRNFLHSGTRWTITKDGDELADWNEVSSHISQPTQSLLIRWLREVKKIVVVALPFGDINKWTFKIYYTESLYTEDYTASKFPTQETAIEHGLLTALENI